MLQGHLERLVLKGNLSPLPVGFLPGQGPPGALQPLPKRPILEKSNGTAAQVFNPSMFHYQQALANMQLQQQTVIHTGESFCTLAKLKRGPLSVYRTCQSSHESLECDS